MKKIWYSENFGEAEPGKPGGTGGTGDKTFVERKGKIAIGSFEQGTVNQLMAAEDAPETPSALLLAFAPLHRVALGVATGVVLGALVFVVTVVGVIRGGVPVLDLSLLAQFFFGYRVTVPGAFIGLLWGFGVGFVSGWSFALLRNTIVWIWLTVIRSRADMEQYRDFLDHL